jgi:hypothetical protein
MQNIGAREVVLTAYLLAFLWATSTLMSLGHYIPGYLQDLVGFEIALGFCGVLIALFACIDKRQIQHLQEEVEALKKRR